MKLPIFRRVFPTLRTAIVMASLQHNFGKPTTVELRVGQAVNIETDVIGKYVLRYLRSLGAARTGGLTLDTLRQAGF